MFGQRKQDCEPEQQTPKTQVVRCITVETVGISEIFTFEDVTNVNWSMDGSILTLREPIGPATIRVGSGTTVSDFYKEVEKEEQTQGRVVHCITIETGGVPDWVCYEGVSDIDWTMDKSFLTFRDPDGLVRIRIGSGTTVIDDFQYPDDDDEEE